MLNGNDFNYLLNALPFSDELQKTDLDILMSNSSKFFYEKSKIIMNDRNECSGVMLLKSGRIRAFLRTEDSKELTLYRLLENDFCVLTASCILKNIDFDVTMQAEKATEIILIPTEIWGTLSESYVSAKQFSMELLNKRFSSVMWVIEQMVSKNMDKRVADFLIEQSKLENSNTIATTHEEIANNLGSAREVISRVLKYLENDGLIELSRGKIKIIEKEKLKMLSR